MTITEVDVAPDLLSAQQAFLAGNYSLARKLICELAPSVDAVILQARVLLRLRRFKEAREIIAPHLFDVLSVTDSARVFAYAALAAASCGDQHAANELQAKITCEGLPADLRAQITYISAADRVSAVRLFSRWLTLRAHLVKYLWRGQHNCRKRYGFARLAARGKGRI